MENQSLPLSFPSFLTANRHLPLLKGKETTEKACERKIKLIKNERFILVKQD
ncbi:hypothetical protein [Streptococcus chenjunshii]|uniref:hypothetical protein n=1 Tax=Streptococcus chenjunshii TaxID=2173853 RepID=UPI0013C2BAB1|nr:hypothetical protein [Streptococcus chenjunshii]